MRRRFDGPLVLRPLEDADARAIVTWRYDGPYAVYNQQADALARLLNPEHRYHAVESPAGELIGFCCFGADARVPGGTYQDQAALDVGGGLRPDLTGQGHGIAFFRAILDFGRERFAAGTFRVTVAAFNRRAIRMCQWAGFEVVERFSTGNDEARDFVVLALSRIRIPSCPSTSSCPCT
jgi:ribosomal-protein-alanine N-acetyltransferase